MCRAAPRFSATTKAQNPGGSVMPPLSGSHIGRVCALIPATRNPSAATAPAMVTARVLLRFTALLPLVSSDYGRIHDSPDSDEELIKSSDTSTPAVGYREGHAEGTTAVYGECVCTPRLARVDRCVSE